MHFRVLVILKRNDRSDIELPVQGVDFCNTRITGGLHSEIGLVVAVRQLRLVPGEMFKKLLGTPHRHFTQKEAIDLLEEVLSHVLGMTE